ncbi:PEP-CTERM sorting domain-containing protein [Methyloversatilis sp. RAC08]|uniref:PEP-CTERM sorting domain-containing protein n=1 Tax=Methyloversatilis sp. RAC08 TaxID=1842540 RepID=UPI00123791CE|nr:PEP-CTERM sorting domain-containing protein [Methyloversatilis sp. RAC08]
MLLTKAEGAPINAYSYSALGDSGFDCRQAYVRVVPEPAPSVLLAGGLFALLALRRC